MLFELAFFSLEELFTSTSSFVGVRALPASKNDGGAKIQNPAFSSSSDIDRSGKEFVAEVVGKSTMDRGKRDSQEEP